MCEDHLAHEEVRFQPRTRRIIGRKRRHAQHLRRKCRERAPAPSRLLPEMGARRELVVHQASPSVLVDQNVAGNPITIGPARARRTRQRPLFNERKHKRSEKSPVNLAECRRFECLIKERPQLRANGVRGRVLQSGFQPFKKLDGMRQCHLGRHPPRGDPGLKRMPLEKLHRQEIEPIDRCEKERPTRNGRAGLRKVLGALPQVPQSRPDCEMADCPSSLADAHRHTRPVITAVEIARQYVPRQGRR